MEEMGPVAIASVGSAYEMEVASNKLSSRFEEVKGKVLNVIKDSGKLQMEEVFGALKILVTIMKSTAMFYALCM